MSNTAKKPLPRWPWVLLLVGIIAAGLAYILTPTPAPHDHSTGTARIGGHFELTDQHGNKFTDANLLGHYSVIYFGYTFCPDVCPTELQSLAQAMDLLPADILAKLQPIFITVDPARDTPEVMGKYVAAFSPKLIGLTGTPAQIEEAEKDYLIYATKVEPKNGDPKDYLMNHISILYVMGPDGKYITHLPQGLPPSAIAASLKKIISQGS